MTAHEARSRVTVDLSAVRRNARTLRSLLGAAELWAVVKADAYGHGAAAVAGTVLEEGAAALCVATVAEGEALRRLHSGARVVVLGPTPALDVPRAVAARLELTSVDGAVPPGVPVHLKLDTGMGRWGASRVGELPENVVGVMSHFATADTDPAFAATQLERFLLLTDGVGLPRHVANSAAVLALPGSLLDAARVGLALYGLSPFGDDPAGHGLVPALSWRTHLAQVKELQPGESTGYGRRFVATHPTWIGLVPVGYADGFRRGLTGTTVLVAGEPRPVVGTVSMDCFAVELDGPLPTGTPVTLIGDGLLAQAHADVLGTITYEVVTGLSSDPARGERVVLDS